MRKSELLSQDAEQSASRLIDEMSRLFYLSRAIHVVAELGVANCIGDDPVPVARLAEATKGSAAALGRLLRFLSAYGIFEECTPDGFRNTALSLTLRDDHPQSMRASLCRVQAFWWKAVGHLEHTVRTGETAFDHVHGVPFFRYLEDNPDTQDRFDEAMARISDADDAAIAAAYDFGRFSRIVDIGGGRGGLLVQILDRAPKAVGILFDQPHVVARSTRLDDADLAGRSEKIGGDFFEAVPAGADCYVIKGVLHDFNDEQCVRILSNCRDALGGNGRVVVANQDIPASVDGPHPNLTMDIQMMALLGGRERTVRDWSDLLERSGFRFADRYETEVGFTLVEGAPS